MCNTMLKQVIILGRERYINPCESNNSVSHDNQRFKKHVPTHPSSGANPWTQCNDRQVKISLLHCHRNRPVIPDNTQRSQGFTPLTQHDLPT